MSTEFSHKCSSVQLVDDDDDKSGMS